MTAHHRPLRRRRWTSAAHEPHTAADHLAHGYAITIHRSQGATYDTTHYIEDGGGRELAYVGMSRARHHATIYRQADNLEQAIDDLTTAWTIERRQEWVIDRTQPAIEQSTPGPQRQAPVVQRSIPADDFGLGL